MNNANKLRWPAILKSFPSISHAYRGSICEWPLPACALFPAEIWACSEINKLRKIYEHLPVCAKAHYVFKGSGVHAIFRRNTPNFTIIPQNWEQTSQATEKPKFSHCCWTFIVDGNSPLSRKTEIASLPLVEQRDPAADPDHCLPWGRPSPVHKASNSRNFIHFGAAKMLCSLSAIIVFA